MRLSLRVYIMVLFVAAVILVTGLSTAYGVRTASHEVRNAIVDRQQRSGAGAANGLSYFFESTRQALISTASVLPAADLRGPDRNALGALLDPLLAVGRDFAAVALIDDSGRPVIVRPAGTPHVLATYASTSGFARLVDTGDPCLSLDAREGPPAWMVAVPAGPYVLLGVLNPYPVEEILFSNVESHADALLHDDTDTVLAATDPSFAPLSIQGWSALEPLRDGTANVVEATSPVLNLGVIVTRASLAPRFQGQVVLLSPRTQLEGVQSGIIRSALLTSGLLAGSALLAGLFAASSITRPVAEVRAAARRMRDGDLAVRARPRGALELRELANDFNAMANTLAREWEQRVKLQNHLEELVRQRTQQLDQRQQDMELFFYGVSHDFKSPVISISNITQMLEEATSEKRLDRAAITHLAQRIRNSSRNLQGLIGELLEFAQAERVAPRLRFVRLPEIFASPVEEAQALAAPRRIRVASAGPSFDVFTDPDRVRHIVANLLSNAVKYMPDRPGGQVELLWTGTDEEFLVVVADNGDGIPSEIVPQLFRPFSRHTRAGSKVAGAGLGLSIVKRLTESLHGSLELDTRPGRGTRFTVRLPRTPRPGPPNGGSSP